MEKKRRRQTIARQIAGLRQCGTIERVIIQDDLKVDPKLIDVLSPLF